LPGYALGIAKLAGKVMPEIAHPRHKDLPQPDQKFPSADPGDESGSRSSLKSPREVQCFGCTYGYIADVFPTAEITTYHPTPFRPQLAIRDGSIATAAGHGLTHRVVAQFANAKCQLDGARKICDCFRSMAYQHIAWTKKCSTVLLGPSFSYRRPFSCGNPCPLQPKTMLTVSARLSTKNFVRLGTWTTPAGTTDTVLEAMNAPIIKYSTTSACGTRICDLAS
jgi:hypothetical protein